MKKLFSILFLLFSYTGSYGQWHFEWNYVTFDPGDVLWQQVINIDTVNYHHNIWQVGQPHKTIFDSAYSYPNAIITDTLNPYPPNDTSVFTLTFPGFAEGGLISFFSFYYQLNIDSGTSIIIEFSKDTGKTWANLVDSIPPNLAYTLPLLTTPGWHEWQLGFNSAVYYSLDTMKIRFTFISGHDTSGKNGWMIDNFGVQYFSEGVQIIQTNYSTSIFPNPANSILTITSKGIINQITIINLIGQPVYSQSSNLGTVNIDVSGLQKGIYFIKINNVELRKFIKE